MKRYASRYCTYGVPDDWEPQPPFGFTEPGQEGEGMSVQAFEQWLERPMAAQHCAENELQALPHLNKGFELLHQGPHRFTRSPGDAYTLTYRHLDEDHEPILSRKIFATLGPLQVEMLLTQPDKETPQKTKLLNDIANTLELRGGDFLSRAQPLSIMEGHTKVPSSEVRQKFPRCCVSLPSLDGWELQPEDGQAVYRRSGAEIRLQRPVGVDPDSAQWLADKMITLQNTQSLLFGSERGELENGSAFAAILYEERGEVRRWKTAAVERILEVAVEGEQMLLWTLRSREALVAECRPVLTSLILEAEFLPPAEWEIVLAEPWLPLRMQGGWRPEGPGVYFNLEEELILQTNQDTSRAPLVDLKSSILESHRTSIDPDVPFEEEELSEKWQGADALRYKVDGTAPTGEPLSLRSFWCTKKETLYSAVLLARDAQLADRRFAPIPSTLELPS